MFLIDLNQCYFKVVNAGQVWTHDLDELQWLVPDAPRQRGDESVHVRRGKEVAIMPLSAVHQWLYPFGPFDAAAVSFPEEYIDEVTKRREPVCFDDDWDDGWDDWAFRPDAGPDCGCESCDGTCEQCTFMERINRSPRPQPAAQHIEDNFGPEDIPA